MEQQMQAGGLSSVEKKMLMVEHVNNTALGMADILKSMPNTGKHRNVFIKSYNRRPRTKQRRNLGMIKLQMYVVSRAIGLAIIIQQPIPKYATGTK